MPYYRNPDEVCPDCEDEPDYQRNPDEEARRIARQALTGDLLAAKKLVRLLEPRLHEVLNRFETSREKAAAQSLRNYHSP